VLRDRIRAFLHPYPPRDRVLDDLLERVTLLESREAAHDVAWAEAKDQISRHLKRVREVERRAGAAGGNGDLSSYVLASKFKRGSE
jgi:hypothetical protein